MTAPTERPNEGGEPVVQSPANPRTAALRAGGETGVFQDTAFEPRHPDADVGLIAGDRDDPVLVCGIGYPMLSDLAFGTVVAYHVASLDIPGVAVADVSHTPITAYQTLDDGAYSTAVVVGAEKRGPGSLTDGTPSHAPGRTREFDASEYPEPDDEELVERVGESALGSNTVENVLVVSEAFGALPETTRVLTVEVGYDSWGTNAAEFTGPVEAAYEDVLDRVVSLVDDALDSHDRTDYHRHHSTVGDGFDGTYGQSDDGPNGDGTPADDPLENERVDGDAIDRLDADARTTLLELERGVVAGRDE